MDFCGWEKKKSLVATQTYSTPRTRKSEGKLGNFCTKLAHGLCRVNILWTTWPPCFSSLLELNEPKNLVHIYGSVLLSSICQQVYRFHFSFGEEQRISMFTKGGKEEDQEYISRMRRGSRSFDIASTLRYKAIRCSVAKPGLTEFGTIQTGVYFPARSTFYKSSMIYYLEKERHRRRKGNCCFCQETVIVPFCLGVGPLGQTKTKHFQFLNSLHLFLSPIILAGYKHITSRLCLCTKVGSPFSMAHIACHTRKWNEGNKTRFLSFYPKERRTRSPEKKPRGNLCCSKPAINIHITLHWTLHPKTKQNEENTTPSLETSGILSSKGIGPHQSPFKNQ